MHMYTNALDLDPENLYPTVGNGPSSALIIGRASPLALGMMGSVLMAGDIRCQGRLRRRPRHSRGCLCNCT